MTDPRDAIADRSGRFTVLLVCRANVCRSPTAELLLRRCLAADSLSDRVDVVSAGLDVESDLPWCAEAAAEVADGPDRMAMLASHRATPVHHDMVVAADLVLAAGREQRAAIARLVPSVSVRTFTMREAAVLVGAVAARMGRPLTEPPDPARSWDVSFSLAPLPSEESPLDRLRWLTAEMHNARGLVPLPGGPAEDGRQGGHWWRRRLRKPMFDPDVNAIDIPDPHGPRPAPHRTDWLAAAVESWSTVARLTVHSTADVESSDIQPR